jgi:hypothetical protein
VSSSPSTIEKTKNVKHLYGMFYFSTVTRRLENKEKQKPMKVEKNKAKKREAITQFVTINEILDTLI